MIAVAAVYGAYFAMVLMAYGSSGELHMAQFVALNVGAVVALIVIQVTYHILIGITSVRQEGHDMGETDERDRDIARRAAGPSGMVLGIGTMMAIIHITIGSAYDNPWFSTLATANLLLLSLVIAQVLEYALQVIQYRRAA